jgi:glycosyltransferase involved in cell wall biosynthesis
MRIVIDLQASQGENRSRGIGRYSLSLALAIARLKGPHEILIVLNGVFSESIEIIKESFKGLLPPESIYVWHGSKGLSGINSANNWRRESSEYLKGLFIDSLEPDIFFVASLFEGLVDDVVSTTKINSSKYPTITTLYDLIPLIHQNQYLVNPDVKRWYLNKIDHLRRSDLILAISESSRQEGIDYLEKNENDVINISADADEQFRILDIGVETESEIRSKYNLDRSFLMYTGGIDHRKNIEALIRSYSKLPKNLRLNHQLAIVCSCDEASRERLMKLAGESGLSSGELVLTGYIPEDDLIVLYNICKLFVFPSWHEGFGLPVLEAMRCGAPVLASSYTSLPEIIGWEKALFDPYSDNSIVEKIQLALEDEDFYKSLKDNSAKQSQRFSWTECGKKTILAMEQLVNSGKYEQATNLNSERRKKLAYISPLAPSKSGISDYSSELLPSLSKYYDIDVVVRDGICTDVWVKKNCAVKTVEWFEKNHKTYERVLYHFGNSEFHSHMFGLLNQIPGVVVLHDFYLSGILAHMDVHGWEPGKWAESLYFSHGYYAFAHRFKAADTAEVVWKYPVSLGVIQDSLGIIAHSNNSLKLAKEWYSESLNSWRVIPHMRNSTIKFSKRTARKKLKLSEDKFIICSYGILGPHKLNKSLLEAFLNSKLAKNKNCILIFVGENHSGEYGCELEKIISASGFSDRIMITGWVGKTQFDLYLAAADVGVQLRTLSRGESSGTVLDCMNQGKATIINSNGSMSDFPDEVAVKLPDKFSEAELINALEKLHDSRALRQNIGDRARGLIIETHDPDECARKYLKAIEGFYSDCKWNSRELSSATIKSFEESIDDVDLFDIAQCIAKNFPPNNRKPQILVDISELVIRDSHSGIQRVVRAILREWLENPPEGFSIEPVYANINEVGYRYARKFTSRFLNCPDDILDDDWIECFDGDYFIGLDLQPHIVDFQKNFYIDLKKLGVVTKFVVYDLLPILMPEYFISGAAKQHEKWLEVITSSNGALCISNAVSNELEEWIDAVKLNQPPYFSNVSFRLGSDLKNSQPSSGLPENHSEILDGISSAESFLMVGTVEPRKGHSQVIDVFDQLWAEGCQVKLVIIGKQGWMVEKLIDRITSHPKFQNELIWIKDASDEFLGMIYEVSKSLIGASYGEGFGLPLIEASANNIEVICRDIPVFREVMGDKAFYFSDSGGKCLKKVVMESLSRLRIGAKPSLNSIKIYSWKESAEDLFRKLIKKTLN